MKTCRGSQARSTAQGLGPCPAVVPRFESAPLHYFFGSLLENMSQPESNSSGESHLRYLPAGKHPRCFPRATNQTQFLHVRPVVLLRDARTSSSSLV